MPKSKGPTWADAVSAPPFTLPPELAMTNEQLQTTHSAACDALRDAEAAFESSLSSLRDAIDRVQRANLRMIETPTEAAEWLSRVAASNRSGWSGGTYSATNIREALTRDIAIEGLRRVRF